MNLSEQYTKLHEAKANPKMVGKMIMAIEKEDEKSLLKFMAMDKKNFFSKKNLDSEAEAGNVTEVEAKKLGKLSIGVASALEAIGGDPMKKEANKKMALERVKEVKSMSESLDEALDGNTLRIALGSLNQAVTKLSDKVEKLRNSDKPEKMDDNQLKASIKEAKDLKGVVSDLTKKFNKK